MKYLKIFEDFNKKPKWAECADCGKFPEDYWFEGWSKYIPKSKQNKYICVSCLEKRVGRELKKSDFKPWNHYYKGQEWYENLNESFNIDEDSEHLKDLSLDLQDEGEWSITIHTNTEKYNEDEYSCKVILEPLDEFDWNTPGINDRGGRINDTLIQYLENIVRYMEDYEYKIFLTSDNVTKEEEITLNSIEEFKKWIEPQLKHQKSISQPDIMNYGFKGDFIIIEFYEKDDQINESISKPQYKYDWCRPESPIRREIEKSVNDILLDLKDSNSIYRHHIWWTQNDPYVWISGALKNDSGFSRHKIILDEVNSVIEEIVSYFKSEGFKTKLDYVPNRENCKQFYIYFTE